jgi:hypothetical protein
MALFAMLTGIALPVHAYANHARNAIPGADFCTTVKPADVVAGNVANAIADTPTAPERVHAVQCDTCCGCGGTAAAPALHRAWPTQANALVVPASLAAVRLPEVSGFALARGPPARA